MTFLQKRRMSDLQPNNEKEHLLSDRKRLILKVIVEAHVKLGEPVGSKYLTAGGQIPYSSATVRNEMAELEEMGYLEQPHTSAGRIPSEAGYRLYVDSLVEHYRLTEREIAELKNMLRVKQMELDSILENAVKIASHLTDHTAIAVKPRQMKVTVSRFEVLPIDENTLVLVMIIGRAAKTKYIRSVRPVSEDAASRMAAVLNMSIAGLDPSEITVPAMMEMERSMGEYDYLVAPVIKAVCETIASFNEGDIKMDGINRMLAYPDYYGFDRLREMLAMFERKDELFKMLTPEINHVGDGVKILIGSENTVKIMDNSTLIFKTVHRGGKPVSTIGIIGPTRMNYGRAIAMIDSLTDGISDLISDGEK